MKPTNILGGPLFEPSQHGGMESIFQKSGGHYNIFRIAEESAIKWLRELFPDGEANEHNFVLFSASGVHGSYCTLDKIEASLRKYGPDKYSIDDSNKGVAPDDWEFPEVTFLIVHPRIVCLRYGNCPVTVEDLPFLRKLAQTSNDAVKKINEGNV